MNQQNSTANKKVKLLKDGALLDGCLLSFCAGRDQLGSNLVYGIVQKEDRWLEEFPVNAIKITGDVTTSWLSIETAPMDGTVIDVWVSDTNAGPIRVIDVKYDAEQEYFMHFENLLGKYKKVYGNERYVALLRWLWGDAGFFYKSRPRRFEA